MEGFDRVVDKYYDTFHDHSIKGYQGIRKRVPTTRKKRKKDSKLTSGHQRSASEPREDRYQRPQDASRNRELSSDDEDRGYDSDHPRRRRGDSRSRENDFTNSAMYAPERHVRINPVDEVRTSGKYLHFYTSLEYQIVVDKN
jgi:hypothetical protein